MPYQPHHYEYDAETAKAEHRERLYWLTLLTGLCNIVLIVLHVTDSHFFLSGWILGGVVGSLLVAAIKGNTDGYYQSLSAVGLQWMAFGVGALALILMPMPERSLADIFLGGLSEYTSDTALMFMVAALTYHAGYAFAYLRDHIGSGDE